MSKICISRVDRNVTFPSLLQVTVSAHTQRHQSAGNAVPACSALPSHHRQGTVTKRHRMDFDTAFDLHVKLSAFKGKICLL